MQTSPDTAVIVGNEGLGHLNRGAGVSTHLEQRAVQPYCSCSHEQAAGSTCLASLPLARCATPESHAGALPGAECRHAAVILGALGDFLLALPLLRALRRSGPVSILSRGPYRALLPPELADSAFVDTDGADGAWLFAESAVLPAVLVKALGGATVHAFIRGDCRLESSVRRAGAAGLVWHDPRPSAPPHIVLRFFAEAGYTPPAGVLGTPVMPRSGPAGDALWLHPGSGSPAKSLPPTVLVALAGQGRARGPSRLVVSFGEADLDLRGPVRQAFLACGLSYTEVVCPSLRELRRRLAAEAAAFIGPDTGVTHLAAALGIPTTVVFRATDPAVWRPVGAVHVLDWRGRAGTSPPPGSPVALTDV